MKFWSCFKILTFASEFSLRSTTGRSASMSNKTKPTEKILHDWNLRNKKQTARNKPPRTSVVNIITCKPQVINYDDAEEIIGELKTYFRNKKQNMWIAFMKNPRTGISELQYLFCWKATTGAMGFRWHICALNSQHPHSSSQLSVTLVPGNHSPLLAKVSNA